MNEMIWFLRYILAMSTRVQYSKSKNKKNSTNIVVKVYNNPIMEKEILAVTMGIKKFLIILASKPFLISNWLQRNTWFCGKKIIKYASARPTYVFIA